MARVWPGFWMFTKRVVPSGEKVEPANSDLFRVVDRAGIFWVGMAVTVGHVGNHNCRIDHANDYLQDLPD